MFLTYRITRFNVIGLLCMRRDVSCIGKVVYSADKSSLHAQRCFYWLSKASKSELVFSACAEMFPKLSKSTTTVKGLLCMRRDVSRTC